MRLRFKGVVLRVPLSGSEWGSWGYREPATFEVGFQIFSEKTIRPRTMILSLGRGTPH